MLTYVECPEKLVVPVNIQQGIFKGHYLVYLETTRWSMSVLHPISDYMLFNCSSNHDVWLNFLSLFSHLARSVNLDIFYYDIISMKISQYKLLDLNLMVNHYNIFSCIIPAIWRAYWHLHFDYFPIDDQTILDLAIKETWKLSALKSL